MELGDRVKYIKTHEGHFCTVTGVITNDKNKIQKIHVRCDCGPYLYLNPKDVKVQK